MTGAENLACIHDNFDAVPFGHRPQHSIVLAIERNGAHRRGGEPLIVDQLAREQRLPQQASSRNRLSRAANNRAGREWASIPPLLRRQFGRSLAASAGRRGRQAVRPVSVTPMSRWRERISADKLETVLAERIAAALKGGAVELNHFERVTIDTTNRKLCHPLRPIVKANTPQRPTKKPTTLRKLKTFLGRLYRDLTRKLDAQLGLREICAETMEVVARLLAQKRDDKHKLYAVHAPKVECIGKGKARTRWEFGIKASLAVTKARAAGAART
jgi:hypothetical protein